MSAQAVLSAIDEDGWRAFEQWQETVADRIDRMEPIIKAKEEGKKEDARNMLADGLPPDKIVQYTGLTLEDVARLSAELEVAR